MPASARAMALDALLATVGDGRMLDDALETALAGDADARERALARELAFGVCRWWVRLAACRDRLLRRPLKARDLDVAMILALGLYQLEYSRIPAHAAVAESVALAKARGKPWAGGLVNAVLRRFVREREACLDAVDADPCARLAHPRWLLDALRAAWPRDWQRIAAANNQRGPMTLRVNARRQTREQALARLAAAGIAAAPTAHARDGVVLAQPCDVSALPGFAAGELSVQDEAAQLAADLLAPAPGERFLDACAAPGGKLAHVIEREPALATAVAVERDARRTQRLCGTLARLALAADVVTGDAGETSRWWDGTPFECILLDAPCSATGVIRRHPDIKLHRTRGDLARLTLTQRALLESLWRLLARGGRLLYATCSVMPEENAEIVARFLDDHADARSPALQVTWGVPAPPGRQILPGEAGMDGFYYALLAKR